MTLNPATWPVGIVPIGFFVLGIVALVNVLFRGKKPTSDTFGIFMGFVPSVLVVIAWFAGYRQASDHALWKFVVLSAVGGMMWIPLRFQVLSKAEFGEMMRIKIAARSRLHLYRNFFLAVTLFLMICGLFGLMEPRLKSPHDCTRLMCEVGAIYLGSQYSSLGFTWILLFFSTLMLGGSFASLIFILKKRD